MAEGYGRALREIREQKGMSRKELAELADVSYSVLRSWEKDRRQPTLGNYEKVLKALGYRLDVVEMVAEG